MIRRLVTILIVAAATTSGSLYWLHDGDLNQIAQDAASLPTPTVPAKR